MHYCKQYDEDEKEPCYPSLCDDLKCEHRLAELERYNRAKVLALELGIDWCAERCCLPCDSPYRRLCDEEIERLRDQYIAIEDLLGGFDTKRQVISLQAERYKRMRKKR
jgi:hypothetical protein